MWLQHVAALGTDKSVPCPRRSVGPRHWLPKSLSLLEAPHFKAPSSCNQTPCGPESLIRIPEVPRMLYAMEAYQRSTLVSFSVPCGSGVLMPVKSYDCPPDSDIPGLPLCQAGLEVNMVCEADAEVYNSNCHVVDQLDNCGRYDIYTMQHQSCAAVGCAALSNFLWVSALVSFGLTIAWTSAFYTQSLWRRQPGEYRRLRGRFILFFVCLALPVVPLFCFFEG